MTVAPGKQSQLPKIIGLIVLIVIVFTVCGQLLESSDVTDSSSDVRTEYACTHFRNVMGDLSDGLYTDSELRTKIQEVNGDAENSSDPAIVAAGTTMLREITIGDADSFLAAAEEFSAACSAAGF